MTATATLIPTGTYTVDPAHSRVGFSVKHLGIATVRGEFGTFEGGLEFGEDGATAYGTVQSASVDTNEPQRDEHLRSADFLDVASFPAITFKSTQIEREGEDTYRVLGDLTIHGVTRPVALEVEGGARVTDPWGGTRTGFSAKTSISRKEFGLTWNVALEAGGFLVGDKLDITLEIEAIKKSATAAA